MRFSIILSLVSLAIVLANDQSSSVHSLELHSLVSRENNKSTSGSGAGTSDGKLTGDPKTCTSIIKILDGCKPNGGSNPKTRRTLSGSDENLLIPRANPSVGAGDPCQKLAAMAKKPQTSSSPKPKSGSPSPDPSSTADAPTRRDLIHNPEHHSLSTRDSKSPSGSGVGSLHGDPKTCTSLIKMMEGCKSGTGTPPKTRRGLFGLDNHPLTRRASPLGDSKTDGADPCQKLQAMAKKPPGSGSTSTNTPKPKSGSNSTPKPSAPPAASSSA
ncbi:hypothetical protein DFH28DRAFT_1105487 [Melampsora americana]|nr:hypothetical protein DFH28DRAFT_1105487 [Melampsora americana]